jgi:hypothetical protein
VYFSPSPTLGLSVLTPGVTARLDGIDGFFDQYFEARQAGDLIRFVVWPGGTYRTSSEPVALDHLPFVLARIVSTDVTWGDIEVLSVSTLGIWAKALPRLRPPSKDRLEGVPVGALTRPVASGSAVWQRDRRWAFRPSWRPLILYAIALEQRVRLVAVIDNAEPGWVADWDQEAPDNRSMPRTRGT